MGDLQSVSARCSKCKQGGQPRRAPDPVTAWWPKNSRGHEVSHVHTVSPEDVQEIHRWTQESGGHAGRGALSFGKPLSLCSRQTSTDQTCTPLHTPQPSPAHFIEGASWHTSALLGENTLNNPWDAGLCRQLTPLGSWLCATVNVHTP